MKNFICMVILSCGLLFAACGKKDDSSATGVKTAPAPTVPSTAKGVGAIPEESRAAKWNLKVHEGNEATLVASHESPEREVLRVDIKKAGTQTGWHIQLNQAPLKVQSGHHYSVTFRARADSARNVFLGFARAHAPWTDLGLYRSLALSPEWHSFQEEFVPSADDDNARILFDLGGSNISAEFVDVKLARIGAG